MLLLANHVLSDISRLLKYLCVLFLSHRPHMIYMVYERISFHHAYHCRMSLSYFETSCQYEVFQDENPSDHRLHVGSYHLVSSQRTLWDKTFGNTQCEQAIVFHL
ncbi:hypothetical protein NY2A_b425R [Paramecium bursaria Chlorella virus NY2A]|uniref:Uncharacterized protein b425R n=1 Tax=Paramecium bursaria Chlorella virus NY2A TaxID=46021 RepID=A7IWV0_PBCVN|nr:hypothetical protein NY2A_b425R [Paramecium bursaria Chlorella virus NY2A]ABT14824.1 hypothetical protein NY2A_b425R [Paramecium bursaria Chlorella virus NY2A]